MAVKSIHETLSDHVVGVTGAPFPLLYAHVVDVTGAPLPLLFLVLCRWLLAVVVVERLLPYLHGDCVNFNGGPLCLAGCARPLHLDRINHLNITSGPSACAPISSKMYGPRVGKVRPHAVCATT